MVDNNLSTWTNLPELWPNLQEVNLQFAQELTIEKLSHFVPRLAFINVLIPSVLAAMVELPPKCDTPEERAEDPGCIDGSLLQELEREEEEVKSVKDVGNLMW